MTYEKAMERLETLAREMEQGNVPIDEMASQLKDAQKLIRYCRDQLYQADQSVRKILSPEKE